MKSLYGQIEEMEVINEKLEESGGEITEELGALIEAHSQELQSKIDSVVGYKTYLDDSLVVISDKKKQIQALEKSVKGQIDRFKNYVLMCMKRADLKKIESPLNRITVPKQRQVLTITNEELIPEKFIKTEFKKSVDKIALKKAIESGEIVEGAKLELGKESILIKGK